MSKLSLTFDNGPSAGITEVVLDALSKSGYTATFFLTGQQLLRPGSRAIAERARREGHRIGNHTFNHGEPLGNIREAGKARSEILAMAEALGDLAAEENFFRPNGRGKIGTHLLNREAVDVLLDMKATVVLWTIVLRDRQIESAGPDAWISGLKSEVLSRDWTVMVMHDRPAGHAAAEPVSYLPMFFEWLAQNKVDVVPDFPDGCVPIRRGMPQPNLKNYCNYMGPG
jgi:peptidoglycan-N-acetylglucosamine deacetylase